jgi:hypothetical protein
MLRYAWIKMTLQMKQADASMGGLIKMLSLLLGGYYYLPSEAFLFTMALVIDRQ